MTPEDLLDAQWGTPDAETVRGADALADAIASGMINIAVHRVNDAGEVEVETYDLDADEARKAVFCAAASATSLGSMTEHQAEGA